MPKRIEKVNELVKEVVSAIVAREIQFPEATLVTITRVETSPDIYYANIFFTVFSSLPGQEASVLSILREKVGIIQHALNRALRMRPVPRITFLLDEAEERREAVERLLKKTH